MSKRTKPPAGGLFPGLAGGEGDPEASRPPSVAPQEPVGPALANGTYSVSHAKRGRFTAMVGTVQKGELAGSRVIYMPVPPNLSDFVGVAFWHDRPYCRAIIWNKYRGSASILPLDGYHYQYEGGWTATEQKIAIFVDLALRAIRVGDEPGGEDHGSHFAAAGYTISRSSRCIACNCALKTQESIAASQCEACASKLEEQ